MKIFNKYYLLLRMKEIDWIKFRYFNIIVMWN